MRIHSAPRCAVTRAVGWDSSEQDGLRWGVEECVTQRSVPTCPDDILQRKQPWRASELQGSDDSVARELPARRDMNVNAVLKNFRALARSLG